jgi:hypothetical protein
VYAEGGYDSPVKCAGNQSTLAMVACWVVEEDEAWKRGAAKRQTLLLPAAWQARVPSFLRRSMLQTLDLTSTRDLVTTKRHC